MDLILHVQTREDLKPEQEILLMAIPVNRHEDGRLIELLQRITDWGNLYASASVHGLLPLLYKRLIALDDVHIPTQFITQLSRDYMANAQRNMRMSRKLIQILEKLSAQSIKAYVFKGPVLAVEAYGELSDRYFSDLDLLIRSMDFSAASRVMVDLGYKPQEVFTQNEIKWLLAGERETAFIGVDHLIEFHWNIAEKGMIYPLSMQHFEMNSIGVNILGKPVSTFSLENTLLMLCIHGTKHGWIQLSWIADLAHFIQNQTQINWDEVVSISVRSGFLRIVLLGLKLASEIGGVELNQEIQVLMEKDRVLEGLAKTAQMNFFPQSDQYKVSEVKQYRYYLQARERIGDRLYFLLDQLFIPKIADWHSIALPSFLYPVYGLLRPFRLFNKFILASRKERR